MPIVDLDRFRSFQIDEKNERKMIDRNFILDNKNNRNQTKMTSNRSGKKNQDLRTKKNGLGVDCGWTFNCCQTLKFLLDFIQAKKKSILFSIDKIGSK